MGACGLSNCKIAKKNRIPITSAPLCPLVCSALLHAGLSLCRPSPAVSLLSAYSSFFSMPGVWVLLLGSRSPIRHYYRHRAPFGVLVIYVKKHLALGKSRGDPWTPLAVMFERVELVSSVLKAHAKKHHVHRGQKGGRGQFYCPK